MSAVATQVWNAAFARVSKLKGFKSYRQSPMDAVQPDMLPCLQCMMLRDSRVADGDANAGEPRFVHRVTLGFEGVILDSMAAQQLVALDAAMNDIDNALFTDGNFASMVEGFESGDCRLVFTRIGEQAVACYQLELVFSFRSQWQPVVPDMLNTIHVETGFPLGGDTGSTQQVTSEYDIPQE